MLHMFVFLMIYWLGNKVMCSAINIYVGGLNALTLAVPTLKVEHMNSHHEM